MSDMIGRLDLRGEERQKRIRILGLGRAYFNATEDVIPGMPMV